MKLVTHSRRGKINEKGGGGLKLVARGFMLIKTSFDMQRSCSEMFDIVPAYCKCSDTVTYATRSFLHSIYIQPDQGAGTAERVSVFSGCSPRWRDDVRRLPHPPHQQR